MQRRHFIRAIGAIGASAIATGIAAPFATAWAQTGTQGVLRVGVRGGVHGRRLLLADFRVKHPA